MYCVEESTCGIVWTFRRVPWRFGARGIVPPLPPSSRPCAPTLHLNRFKQIDNQQYDSHTDPSTVYVRIYIIITAV